MPVIYIENKPYKVPEGKNLLEACLELGFDIPYFCWHPALGSIGSCRVCAVKKFRDDKDTKGRIIMSCMEPVAENLRISIDDPEAREFRKSMIELLMTNHPHDCPVCDEGGECHLQDMTLMTGHNYRRYRFNKRTHKNQNLGSFINHEMNRCIQCYRCVRYYHDYAGGKDLNVFAAHNHVYFGRHEDGTLESEFSGNLVEICPTGVFTDKTFKSHFVRKWDLSSSPSVCVYCGLGCNIFLCERNGTAKRIRSRFNGNVNGYFICDRGRFGYDFVNSAKRIKRVEDYAKSEWKYNVDEPVEKKRTMRKLKHIIILAHAIGIGSPRASLEANYALRKLVGEENFYSGFSHIEQYVISYAVSVMQETRAHIPTLRETEASDAVLILGEDVVNTAPMLALGLRQSLKNHVKKTADRLKINKWDDRATRNVMKSDRGGIFVLTPLSSSLDDVAVISARLSPTRISQIGYAIAYFIEGDTSSIEKLSLNSDEKRIAEDIAAELSKAENPLIVSGTGCLYRSLIEAAAFVADSLSSGPKRAGLFLALPECNSAGAALLGGKSIFDAVERIDLREIDCVYILENDLYRRAKRSILDEFLGSMEYVIAIDNYVNDTTKRADIVLPSSSFAESEATIINSEGRAQRYYRSMEPKGETQDSWRWLREMIMVSENEDAQKDAKNWTNIDDVVRSLCKDIPFFKEINKIAPDAGFRLGGQKIPRQPQRYSGRTAEKAHITLRAEKVPEDTDSPLSYSMEGSRLTPPESLVPFYWSPGWNSDQSMIKYQSGTGGHFGRRIYKSEKKSITELSPILPVMLREKELQILPFQSIFGSEELSILSSYISERMEHPCLLMSRADASRLGIEDNSAVFITARDYKIKIGVEIRDDIIEGSAFYPLGFPDVEFMDLPLVCKIEKYNV